MKKLSLLLLCTLLGAASLRAQTWDCGYCGTDADCTPTSAVKATLINGTLTISGSGAMKNYFNPWRDFPVKSVIVVNGVTAIGNYAFYNCKEVTDVSIPDGVISIGELAFASCGITSVRIPNSVTAIGKQAFSRCHKLTNITVEEGNRSYISEEGVLFGMGKIILIQYPTGKSDASYAIPNGVVAIGNYAFRFCSNLTSVRIPSSVSIIAGEAFAECTSLGMLLTLNPQPPVVGEDAFRNIDKTTCVLRVPAESASLYQAAEGWWEFTKVMELGETNPKPTMR